MGKKLYELSFEHRIRIKYMIFGWVSALSMIGIVNLFGLIGDYIFFTIGQSPFEPIKSIDAVWSILTPLAVWLWYSKAKPTKHPHLNETVGLKEDYDRVKEL